MFKRVSILALALLFFSLPVFAQGTVRIDAAGNGDFVMKAATAVGYSQWLDVYNYGFTSHRLTYRVQGTPASFTLTLECSNTGSDSATSVLGTGSTVTGGAITATATPCTRVRWHLSALSGTVTLYLTYHGSFDGSAAASTVAISQTTTDNDVDVTSVVPGTGATALGKAEDGTPANGDTGVAEMCIVQATLSATTSDTKYGIPKCNSNSVLYVQSVFQTTADAAEDAAVATPPVPIGGVYRAGTGSDAVLDDGDVGYFLIDPDGRIIPKPYARSADDLAGLITTAMTGTTSTAVTGMGAQGGSVRNYITQCTVSNAHATVGTDLILQDGNGGATLWNMPAAANYGGSIVVFPNPLKTTANTALYAANVTTGASTKLACVGYKGL